MKQDQKTACGLILAIDLAICSQSCLGHYVAGCLCLDADEVIRTASKVVNSAPYSRPCSLCLPTILALCLLLMYALFLSDVKGFDFF